MGGRLAGWREDGLGQKAEAETKRIDEAAEGIQRGAANKFVFLLTRQNKSLRI